MIQHRLMNSRGARLALFVIASAAILPGPGCTQNTTREAAGEWSYFGGSHRFDRYSPLSQINKDNVGDLQVAWERSSVDASLTEPFPDVTPSNYLRGTS